MVEMAVGEDKEIYSGGGLKDGSGEDGGGS